MVLWLFGLQVVLSVWGWYNTVTAVFVCWVRCFVFKCCVLWVLIYEFVCSGGLLLLILVCLCCRDLRVLVSLLAVGFVLYVLVACAICLFYVCFWFVLVCCGLRISCCVCLFLVIRLYLLLAFDVCVGVRLGFDCFVSIL